jgi:hypothetical protein
MVQRRPLGAEKRGYALVADPAKGLELVDRRTFEYSYSGNALLTASVQIQRNSGYIGEVIGGAAHYDTPYFHE